MLCENVSEKIKSNWIELKWISYKILYKIEESGILRIFKIK